MNIEELLKMMVAKNGSDLHLTVGQPPQLRIDGELAPMDFPKLKPDTVEDLVREMLNKEHFDRFQKSKEYDGSFGIPGLSRFRINIFRQRGSIGAAIRAIPHEIPSMKALGLPDAVREFAEEPVGLVLVTGATGSGKSTTLASMIDYINQTRKCHIISIEDPIEYLHKHNKSTINQRELGQDTVSFTEALKHVFRQDPDVVLIGEMRDLETIHMALTLAETGHLVLATLHTSDAIHTISRIIDVFPSHQQDQIRIQLSMVLIGVLAQQLLPKKGGGRRLALEVMHVTPAIQNLIRENAIHQIYSIIQTGKKRGMVTMNQSLCQLYEDGIVAWDDVSKRSPSVDELISITKKKPEGVGAKRR